MNKSIKTISLLLFSATCALQSCIKEEALNAECDIVGIDTLWLAAHRDIFIGEPQVSNNRISFTIKKGTDRTALNPSFYLTEGAHITASLDGAETAANGIVRDFSSPQIYTVHSEDGLWKKSYTVSFNFPTALKALSFEHFDLEKGGRYYQWYEEDENDTENPRRDYWASGNAGFALTGKGKTAADYPTSPDYSGVSGCCVMLKTCDTGSFGSSVGMPIAAGNLFIGEFKVNQAMVYPLQATRFGRQLLGSKPISLSGFYKYTAGESFTDKNKNIRPDLADTCDIYSVVYEVDPNQFVPLNGADVLSSDRIVLLSRIQNPGEPENWTYFEEPYRLIPGKTFSEERLRNDGYAIAIVATSSRQGAFFEGAIGSVLYIDELKVKWEDEE